MATAETIKRDTNADLMRAVHGLVAQNGCYAVAEPIIDYFLPESINVRKLTDYHFDFLTCVNFGGSEGIYLDCFLKGSFDQSGQKMIGCGTYKTLNEDLKAMQIMGALAGSLTFFAHQYVNRELSRYEPDNIGSANKKDL